MAMTQSEIEAAIAALEQARLARLTGGARKRVNYPGIGVEFEYASIEDINMEIARLKVQLGQLTGECSGVGPIRPGFGARL